MHIHGLTVDRGGCFYYRIKQPLKALRDRGHWTSWGSVIDDGTMARADVIVAQMLNFPTTCQTWKQWAARGDKLLVWEADDDITAVHKQAAHGKVYENPETVPRMGEMIAAAHLVTVTTEALAKVYRQWNPHVVVLPNYVPDDLVKTPMPPRGHGGRERLVLGYTGSPSHRDDFEAWSLTYARWMRHNADRTTLRLYGPDRPPIGMPATWRCEIQPWQNMTEDYLTGLRMDVGIAPVLDTRFNRGKSGIKALEYGALGIPAVVSNLQQYRDVIVQGSTGYLCTSPTSWLDAFTQLWDNPQLRADMGAAARDHVTANHLQGPNAWRWETAYTDAMERIGLR